jgi:hypothetical protein
LRVDYAPLGHEKRALFCSLFNGAELWDELEMTVERSGFRPFEVTIPARDWRD